MLWEDERLNYTGLANYTRLEFGGDDVDRIWQPDVYFLNDRNYESHKVTANNVMIHVYRNGTIVYSARHVYLFITFLSITSIVLLDTRLLW